MELRLLEYFLTVVREENISRAAEVLHVTQPTLSRQMKELEDELHTTLFIRGKRLTLTDSGVMSRIRTGHCCNYESYQQRCTSCRARHRLCADDRGLRRSV